MNGVQLVTSTNDIGFVTDRDGVIRSWNEAAEESFGVPAEEAIGRACWELLDGKDAFGNDYCGPHCPLIRMALEDRQVRRCQLFLADAAGDRKPYSVTTLLIRGTEPLDPAIVHLLHPALWERRRTCVEEPAVTANRERGELTARELEVLALLAEGQATAEVAAALRISSATASNHIQHILHKLNVHSRLEAVLLAKKLKLV